MSAWFISMFMILGSWNIAISQTSPQFYDYPHNHLPWFTIETEYFSIHFQEGSEWSAKHTATVADSIYTPITDLYNYTPDRKISIVLRDREDFSNGAAFFFDNKIEIWTPALDTPLRGTHDWLENVITHEFTHMIQLGASMKRENSIPAIYFQWLSYEDVRRPDVLYGFPKGVITLPFASLSIPAWFAEGTAQFQRTGLINDYWDSHRDMLLRTSILSNSYLSFTEMGHFSSKSSLEREFVYNQGFGFTIYLADRFGEDVLAEITSASAGGKHGNFSKTIESVTGYSGEQLFQEWIDEKRYEYDQVNQTLGTSTSTNIESKGFFNFHPQFSPEGERFAYLSNRGRDYARNTLVLVQDGELTEVDDLRSTQTLSDGQNYQLSHGFSSNTALDFISSRFSFSPDGNKIIYSRAEKNRVGETYNDLYIYDIHDELSQQITSNARIQDPNWHPSLKNIAAVQFSNGTQNIVLVDPESGNITALTNFQYGETIHSPVWNSDGSKIYFAAAIQSNRNIYYYSLNEDEIIPVFESKFVDFRDPWIDSDGNYLYFSSDVTGIFNIYRVHLDTNQIEQMTNVLGGTFMPHVKGAQLYASEYKNDGYKITRFPVSGNPVDFFNRYMKSETSQAEFLAYNDEITSKPTSTQQIEAYSETTTGLSVFPVVRFDNYSKINGGNGALIRSGELGSLSENLWRDLKVGAYFSTRDVTENISLFAGALLGIGSRPADGIGDFFTPARINNLDRDLFFIAEHRGLPFIKRSWSPTVSIELYNLKRNVQNGLEFEEFRCTSCLPETRQVDTRYSIWEANLFLRSKLNRWSLLELGATYSPYSVSSDGFFSEEYQEFIPGSTSDYFKGATFTAAYHAELIEPTRHSDIAPKGVKSSFIYKFQPGRLLDRFELDEGSLSPIYESEKNHSIEWKGQYGFSITDRSTGLITSRAFSYLNNPDDYFYLDYSGGLGGLRSYPFFAIGGQRTAFIRTSFITPLVEHINRQVGAYTLDKLYAHIFAETGNGWGGPLGIGNNLKSGVGAELRFAFNNAYLFPMKFFINTSYGLNRFDVNLPSQFVTTQDRETVRYGGEILFYFGLTFDFDLL
jgi:Tol biopolymer transport system component